MPATPIRIARSVDETLLVDILADAFADDPIMNWAFGAEERLANGLPLTFQAFLRAHYLALGACDLTTDGAAVWAPPGKHDPGLAVLRALPTLLRAFGPRIGRPLALLLAMDKHHPREPHWYLFFLGVRARAQGNGIGGALLDDRLAAVDAVGMPGYLESSNPRNLTLYERHGFRTVREIRAAKTAPPLYAMWREPS